MKPVEGGSTGPDTPQQFFYDKPWMWDVTYEHMWPVDSNKAVFQFAQEYEQSKRINAAASVQGETLSDRINALPEWARQHIHDIETKCDPAGDIRTIGELRDTVAALTAEIEELRKDHIEWRVPDPALCDNQHNHPKLCHCLDPLYWKERAEAAETLVGELRTGLSNYGSHCEDCETQAGETVSLRDEEKCDCGFQELLTRTLKKKEDGK